MTVSSTSNRNGPYLANGSTTVFARTFQLDDEDDLVVYQTSVAGIDSVVTSGFTVDGVGTASGNVTFTTAPADGTQITLVREMTFTQESDYTAQGTATPENVERDFDETVMRDQELQDGLSRSLKVQPSDGSAPTILTLSDNAVLTTDDDGNITTSITVASIEALEAALAYLIAQGAFVDIAAGMFDLRTYIGAQEGGINQLAYIEAGDVDSQDADIVTAGVQAWSQACLTFGVAPTGAYRIQPIARGGVGTYAINDEIFNETAAQTIWDYDISLFQCIWDLRGTIFQAKGWPAHAKARTSGRYDALGITDIVPTAMFRWEQKGGHTKGPTIYGGTFIGEEATTDPNGMILCNINRSLIVAPVFQKLYATGITIHGINNSDIHRPTVAQCGWQPTEAGGDGFTSEDVTVTTTAGASTTAVVATEDIFDAAHVGRWVSITVPGSYPNFQGQVASVADAKNATVTGVAENDGSGQTITFDIIRGAISAASNILTLTGPAFTQDVIGRTVAIWKAGSTVHTEKDVLVTRVTGQSGSTLTLAHFAANSVTDAPVVFSPSEVISKSDDFYTVQGGGELFDIVGFNDVHVIGGHYENSSSRASLMGLYGDCKGAHWTGCKWHGADLDPNAGANAATLWLDNCDEMHMDGTYVAWGWSPDFGTIMCSGEHGRVMMNGSILGSWAPGDHSALFYVDPQGSGDPWDIFISGSFHSNNTYWGRATQSFVRYGLYGSSNMVMLSGPMTQNEGQYPTDLPAMWIPGGGIKRAADGKADYYEWNNGYLVRVPRMSELAQMLSETMIDAPGVIKPSHMAEISPKTFLMNPGGTPNNPVSSTPDQALEALGAEATNTSTTLAATNPYNGLKTYRKRGTVTVSSGNTSQVHRYPIPFPNDVIGTPIVQLQGTTPNFAVSVANLTKSDEGFTVYIKTSAGATIGSDVTVTYEAEGY